MPLIRMLAVLILAASSVLLAVKSRAGAELVVFPEGYAKGVLYGTVDRADLKQFRELYVTADAVAAHKAGKALPSGTVFTLVQYKAKLDATGNPVKDANGRFVKDTLVGYAVMEKRTGWGQAYGPDMRNGEWEYQAFNAERKVNEKANIKGCFTCHLPHAAKDYLFTLDMLKK